MGTLHQAKTICVIVIFHLFLIPVVWLPMYVYKWLIYISARLFFPRYGKSFAHIDYIIEEDLGKAAPPKGSLLCSIELDGDMGLYELRELFRRNVLEAGIVKKTDTSAGMMEFKVRYPELKQCPRSFMGYTFWRDVEGFSLEEHILEVKPRPGEMSLSLIHEEALNRVYSPGKSPWDIVLMRRLATSNGNDPDKMGSLLIARFHHSMADAKSMLKLFVECLGGKLLITAQPRVEESLSLCLRYRYPFQIVAALTKFSLRTFQDLAHRWKNVSSGVGQGELRQVVRFSDKLLLNDLKQVGKRFGGTTSSVMLAVLSGAIREVDPDIGIFISGYILPKPDHPSTLTNHFNSGALILPTDEKLPRDRLLRCNKIFQQLKSLNVDKYLNFFARSVGAETSSFRKAHVKALRAGSPPVGITNIAGEGKGFSVGGCACSEMMFSVGTFEGCGVVFCISSYKDHCRIAVISSGGVLSPSQVEGMAEGMKGELEILKGL